MGADTLWFPFGGRAIESLSCLHVAEHVGLGRYDDPLDPKGTLKTGYELTRVLSPGVSLLFAVPVGQPKVCFNAHRIHAAEPICEYFSGLELREFSGVHDDGRYVKRVAWDTFRCSEYACGMYWFQKPL